MSKANPIGRSTVHGYPRIGGKRELKKATEDFWKNAIDESALLKVGAGLREQTWTTMRDAGIDEIPSNTFSFYDQMADNVALFGAVAERHRRNDDLSTYFAMARGDSEAHPLEMTKWFDTNYHYLVPEIAPDTSFELVGTKPLDEYRQAKSLGIETRPVVIGPVTFLLLSKTHPATDNEDFQPLSKLDELTEAYVKLLERLAVAGVEWVQLDEPSFVQDRSPEEIDALSRTYQRLGSLESRPKLLVSSYFGPIGNALEPLARTPIEAIGLDFTSRGADNLDRVAGMGGLAGKRLVAGVVDGRNVWTNDLARSLATLNALSGLADEVVVSSSCSLMHVPLDRELEAQLSDDVRPWLAFARQKLDEIATLGKALTDGPDSVAAELSTNAAALESRRSSDYVVNRSVRERLSNIASGDDRRGAPFEAREAEQAKRFGLHDFPTTTIGSFPQTPEIRKHRAAHAKGETDTPTYEAQLQNEIAHVVKLQEQIGIDVLVHGEAERNDMVQYFAEQLDGCLTTSTGWVQSYGTRYVRPPIIAGDISRPEPMTVRWSTYAQSLTNKPMKGMLTGPVTMLCWSFVRDDQPWGDTVTQMALALRDEVNDLETASIGIIQVDEPALREGLPLRSELQEAYLDVATRAFRITTSGVRNETQIHTHMCYAEFGEIVDAVASLDADVISLEATRSDMRIADELVAGKYAAQVGPGVYDIHSPRVPTVDAIAQMLSYAADRLDRSQLWVNPDCGLKTRQEPEVVAALTNMVEAAGRVRNQQ